MNSKSIHNVKVIFNANDNIYMTTGILKMGVRMGLIYGVGVNDSGYTTQKFKIDQQGNRKLEWICPYYKKWKYMLERGYCHSLKQKAPTYENVEVCSDWLVFSVFKNWAITYEQSTGIDVEEYQLDKDILLEGNKTYSPTTCCFVTSKLNKFLTDSSKARGICLLGVHLSRGKYLACCSDPFNPYENSRNSKKIFLGRFDNELDAHLSYCQCKLDITKKIISDGLVYYDKRIEVGLLSRYQSLYDRAKHLYSIK